MMNNKKAVRIISVVLAVLMAGSALTILISVLAR